MAGSVRLIALFASLLGAAVLLVQPSPAHADDQADELAALINQARIARGRTPLARSPELDAAAQAHSQDMVDHHYLDHTGSDGSTPQQRADRAGYHVPPNSGWIVVEVISAISADPRGPLDWWLNDDPAVHGKVVLDPRWREMGVGYAAGGDYGNYWTVDFGCRPTVVPIVVGDGRSYQLTEQCGDPAALAPEVAGATAARPTLSLASSTVSAGQDANVQWSDIPAAKATDWLGLYRPGDADTAYLDWVYVSCAQMPLTPRPSGWCDVRVPSSFPAGQYEVRLFSANGYQRLGAPIPLTVTEPAPPSTVSSIPDTR